MHGDSQTISSAFENQSFKLGQDKISSRIIMEILEKQKKEKKY